MLKNTKVFHYETLSLDLLQTEMNYLNHKTNDI